MKSKFIFQTILVGLTFLSTVKSNAQEWHITPPGNAVVGGDYLGANAASTAPLLIQTIPNQPINFATFGTQQMTILGNGNVGIGLAAPTNLLHLHQAGVSSSLWEQFTNGNTGATATNGFQVGLNYNATNINSDAELRQYETADMNFYTDYNNTSTPRMSIMGFNSMPLWGNNTGYVGIGNTQPLSMLHIGNMNCYNGFYCPGGIVPRAGWRPWMITGTYMCGVPGVNSSDQMYVGLKNDGGLDDRDDAVINWGDNIGALGQADGPDNLRFIFSEYCLDPGSDGIASGMDGLEVMRMMPYIDPATNAFVSLNTGVGNYFANSPVIPPQRRFEILDGLDDGGVHLNQPQFRLTYRQDATITLGIHTDFQVMSGGDLFINPRNNNNLRGVGIGTSAPGSELEVFRGNGGGTAYPHLRLTQTSPAAGTAFAPITGVFTDFQTEIGTGNLNIFPTSQGYATAGTYTGLGIVQIGFPGNSTYGYILNPNLVLDVNGQQNIRSVIQNDVLTEVLVRDPANNGRIMWRDAMTFGTLTAAQNATNIVGGNTVEWGFNPLLHNTEVPMLNGLGGFNNEWSVYYSGQSTMANTLPGPGRNKVDIGIGYAVNTTLDAKLDVYNVNHSLFGFSCINFNAGRFINTGDCNVDPFFNDFVGVNGVCNILPLISLKNFNIGGDFYGSTNKQNIGARGSAIIAAAYGGTAQINLGVVGVTKNALNNIAGHFSASALTFTLPVAHDIGVYCSVPHQAMGAVPNYALFATVTGAWVGTSTPDYAGYFRGDIGGTGTNLYVSDSTLKNNIQILTNDSAINLIRHLKPKTFDFDTAQYNFMDLPRGGQCGLISQEVQTILPQLVKPSVFPEMDDSIGTVLNQPVDYLALNYTGLIPICIGGIKELDSVSTAQQQQNDALQSQLSDLQQQVGALQDQVQQLLNCCQSGAPENPGLHQNPNDGGYNNSNRQQQIVELNNYAIILDQNSPNPFAEQTTITFKIPTDVKDAQIIFSDDRGSVIKTVQINTRGAGSLLVYASNLSSGIYSYSLLADGKLIDTKKMILSKN